jgi:uncharacterized protein
VAADEFELGPCIERMGDVSELSFEWSPAKADSNRRKHGVTFEEATTVFGDPLSRTIPVPDHSSDEDRYITMGRSKSHGILVVVHTDRGAKIRLISARKADASERRQYEKRTEKTV